MTEGLITKIQQNQLLSRLYLLGSGGCQPLLAVSLNQRVQGSSPCAPTIEPPEIKQKTARTVSSQRAAIWFADP
jgi:hypothetical protein